jgi:hypothetical protein
MSHCADYADNSGRKPTRTVGDDSSVSARARIELIASETILFRLLDRTDLDPSTHQFRIVSYRKQNGLVGCVKSELPSRPFGHWTGTQ